HRPLVVGTCLDLRHWPSRLVAFKTQSEVRQTCCSYLVALTVRTPGDVSLGYRICTEYTGSYLLTAPQTSLALSSIYPVCRCISAMAAISASPCPFCCICYPNAK